MKILYINALYSPFVAGGAERSLKLIVEGMQARGHAVVVLSMVPDGGLRREEVDGVPVYRAGLKNGYWPFSEQRPNRARRFLWHWCDRHNRAMARYVRNVIEREQPDVVACHNLVGWSIAVWDTVRKAGIPVVQVLHDYYLLSPDSTMYKSRIDYVHQSRLAKFLRWGYARRSGQVAAVVGISHSVLRRFEAFGYFRGVRQYVIHNARAIPETGQPRVRQPGDPMVMGYIGTLSGPKGVDWLISAFKTSGVEGELLIAGTGQSETMKLLRWFARIHPRIRFLGQVDAQEFYAKIDVLVVPSMWEEPLGMVAIEALANHRPVIASNRGGLPETVVDGQNGLLFDAGNPDTLAPAMRKLWQDPALYNRLAAAARPSVGEFLDVSRMVGQYEEALTQAIV